MIGRLKIPKEIRRTADAGKRVLGVPVRDPDPRQRLVGGGPDRVGGILRRAVLQHVAERARILDRPGREL